MMQVTPTLVRILHIPLSLRSRPEPDLPRTYAPIGLAYPTSSESPYIIQVSWRWRAYFWVI
jgi:hypothetical protein